MALFKKKSAQDIIVEAKLAYARGNVAEASRLLHSLKYNDLRNYGEALYLLSKIYLDTISQLTDQKDIDNKYQVIEGFLSRAKELSHKESKILYDQYFDANGHLKLNSSEEKKENIIENKPTENKTVNIQKEVLPKQPEQKVEKKIEPIVVNKPKEIKKEEDNKDNINTKYAHEQEYRDFSQDIIKTIQNYMYNTVKDNVTVYNGRWVSPQEAKEINKVFPELKTEEIIIYKFDSSKFKKNWFAFTRTDYYDSFKTHASIKDVIKYETFENRYYGTMTRFYYKDGRSAEYKFNLYPKCVFDITQKMSNLGRSIRDEGYNYQTKKDYKSAYEHYLASAMVYDNDIAKNDLGILYQYGYYVNKDIDRAIYWYELSSKQNNVHAQGNLGRVYYNLKHFDKAVHYLTLAVKNNTTNSNDYNVLGVCYLNGEGVKFDLEYAVKYFKLASDKGNMYGDYNIGRVYNFYMNNYEVGIEYYNKAAQKGHSHSNIFLGLAYFFGQGVDVDYKKALEYYNTAIRINDNSYGYANIGSYYAKIENNMERAMDYYNKAIEHGWNEYAVIASLYLNPSYNKVNYTEALKWLNKGIDANNVVCKFRLALMYIYGFGVEQDFNKAYEIISNTDDQKNMSIRALLGQMYIEGKGVEKNIAYGKQLLEEAIERNNTYAIYYKGCSLIEGEYLSKDINLGVGYLITLYKIKGDDIADISHSKLLEYIINSKYDLINECDDDNLLYLFNNVDLTQYPIKQIEIAHTLFMKRQKSNVKIFALLAKNYHFGIKDSVYYNDAIYFYEKCLYSLDYKYDSEIEFNYASLRFEGKGSIQDFVYGFNMAKAIGAYDGKCPDNVEPYLEGKDKFISLVVQYLDKCKIFEYVRYAASLVDLNKPEYAHLKEIVEAKQGRLFYEKAMDIVANLEYKQQRDNEELAKLPENSIAYDKKDMKFREQYEAIHYDIVNALLEAADNGSFEAIDYISENYSDEPSYINYITHLNYSFRLMKFYDDKGILDQALYLRSTYSNDNMKEYDFITDKLRELIIARNDNNSIVDKALKFIYSTYNGHSDRILIKDNVYFQVLKQYYTNNNIYCNKYPRAKYALGFVGDPNDLRIDYTPLRYVYIDFDIAHVDEFEYNFMNNTHEYFEGLNMFNTNNIYIKENKIINLFDINAYEKNIEFTYKTGDNVKLEFIGIEDVQEHVLYFIKKFTDIRNFNKLKNENLDGYYSMNKVVFFFERDGKYYFENLDTKKYVEVDREKTVYMASHFDGLYETYIIFKGQTPLFVFNVETKQRLL